MTQEQATNRARNLNATAHPSLQYNAEPFAPTRWERQDRWGVTLRHKDVHDYVGIAAS